MNTALSTTLKLSECQDINMSELNKNSEDTNGAIAKEDTVVIKEDTTVVKEEPATIVSKEDAVSRNYINIAIVGHVSNGKTTLVGALTDVNTKRDSAEKKTGATIKLGYANCKLWKCNDCNIVLSSGQKTQSMRCTKCQKNATLEHYISFVDAPGHHKYIQTMAAGTTVVDGAILVTDVRKDNVQVQTIEHLAILTILGIKNIIVVQNKVDLVSTEQCVTHYNMLKVYLKGTAAENAPIIPISTQSRINIGDLCRYLDLICRNAKLTPINSKVFSIIRSFDVNKPSDKGTRKGGVLGGTVLGDTKFSIGDEIEIRPGNLVDGKYIPLKTKIESIFSETDSCTTVARGGLYGIGTTLDPIDTKANKLVGSLFGIPGNLPEIVQTLLVTVKYLKLSDRDASDEVTKANSKIKKNTIYQLIIGNNTVLATAKKVDAHLYEFKMNKPICTTEVVCLIYTHESSNTQLIAFGTFGDKADTPVAAIEQTIDEYQTILGTKEVVETKKITIPIPKLGRENRNVIWLNVAEFCDAIKRPVTKVTKFIADETLLDVSMCPNGLRMYKTNMREKQMLSLLKKFVIEFVACKQCKSIDTSEIVCNNCKAIVREI